VQPENTNVQPENTNVQPENTNVQPENTNVQPENTNVQPGNKNATTIIIGLIVIIVIVIFMLISFRVQIFSKTIITTVPITTTFITTIERLNFSQNATLNTLAINRSNVLFGIPDQSQFELMYYNVTPTGDYSSIYGLNFTAPIMTGTKETSVTYSPVIPSAYLNVSYPVSVFITITSYTASTAMSTYNEWFSPNASGAFTNGTYYVNATGYFSKNASKAHVLEVNMTRYSPGIGNASTAIDFNSIYHLDNYEVAFVYGRDVVVVNTYGIVGRYNYTYANNIAKHIYNLLANTTKLP